ncbi:hypothetical protein AAVH_28043 [Aphelenchoides avenae]|nr:hypothetical protein AAVH_28043 [Aphelenchus avenae]
MPKIQILPDNVPTLGEVLADVDPEKNPPRDPRKAQPSFRDAMHRGDQRATALARAQDERPSDTTVGATPSSDPNKQAEPVVGAEPSGGSQ